MNAEFDLIATALHSARDLLTGGDVASANALLEEVEASLAQIAAAPSERVRCAALVEGYDGTGVPWGKARAEMIGLIRGEPAKMDLPTEDVHITKKKTRL